MSSRLRARAEITSHSGARVGGQSWTSFCSLSTLRIAPLRAAARRPAGFVARSSRTAPGTHRRSRLASGPGGLQQNANLFLREPLAVDFVGWLLDITIHAGYIALRWGVAPGHCSGPRPSARFLGIRSGNAYSGGGETIAVEVESFSGDGVAPVCVIPVRSGGSRLDETHDDSVCFLDHR